MKILKYTYHERKEALRKQKRMDERVINPLGTLSRMKKAQEKRNRKKTRLLDKYIMADLVEEVDDGRIITKDGLDITHVFTT